MRQLVLLAVALFAVSACAVVTVPVKVATTAVGTAVDIVD